MADPRRWQLAGMLVPITALASWQLLTSAGVLHFGYLPAPVGILSALVADIRSGELPARRRTPWAWWAPRRLSR